MEKFVARDPKKDPHLAVNKSAKDRAAQLPTPQEETYYAVEYQKSFYIGRVLQRSDDSHAMYKFLHKCSSQMFDWPKRDDIETCHDSCVFYGPMSVVGNTPFTSPQLMEIDQVFNWLRKSRETKK